MLTLVLQSPILSTVVQFRNRQRIEKAEVDALQAHKAGGPIRTEIPVNATKCGHPMSWFGVIVPPSLELRWQE